MLVQSAAHVVKNSLAQTVYNVTSNIVAKSGTIAMPNDLTETARTDHYLFLGFADKDQNSEGGGDIRKLEIADDSAVEMAQTRISTCQEASTPFGAVKAEATTSTVS